MQGRFLDGVLQPYCIYFSILGFEPISFRLSAHPAVSKSLHVLYTSFLLFGGVWSSCLRFTYIMKRDDKAVVDKVLDEMKCLILVSVFIVEVLESSIHQQTINRLYGRFQIIHDQFLKSRQIALGTTDVKLKLFWNCGIVSILHIAFLILLCFYVKIEKEHWIHYMPAAIFVELSINGKCTQFCSFLVIYLEMLKKLIASAEEIIHRVQNNQYKPEYNRECVYKLLPMLQGVYGEMFDISKTLSLCFGWSLATIFLGLYLYLTIQCYWVFVTMLENHSNLQKGVAILSVLSATLLLYKPCRLSYDCTKLNEQMQGMFLRADWNEKDQVLNSYLKEFLLQMHHETLIFSAKGLFDVNSESIAQLAMSSMTYLLICIQFRMSN